MIEQFFETNKFKLEADSEASCNARNHARALGRAFDTYREKLHNELMERRPTPTR
jgi:hypothetical protein